MSVIVEPVDRANLRVAFPIVREAEPAADLAGWLDYARRFTKGRRGPSGILAARHTGRAYPCGLVCYRREPDLVLGHVLRSEHIIAIDVRDPNAVLAAMLAELERLAKALDCAAIRSAIRGGRSTIASHLSAAGHALESVQQYRLMVPPTAAEHNG
jgi:hypothetical protein